MENAFPKLELLQRWAQASTPSWIPDTQSFTYDILWTCHALTLPAKRMSLLQLNQWESQSVVGAETIIMSKLTALNATNNTRLPRKTRLHYCYWKIWLHYILLKVLAWLPWVWRRQATLVPGPINWFLKQPYSSVLCLLLAEHYSKHLLSRRILGRKTETQFSNQKLETMQMISAVKIDGKVTLQSSPNQATRRQRCLVSILKQVNALIWRVHLSVTVRYRHRVRDAGSGSSHLGWDGMQQCSCVRVWECVCVCIYFHVCLSESWRGK